LQQARFGLGAAGVNGKVYAIGGVAENSQIVGTNEEYDPVTDTWTYKTPMPTPRYKFATALYEKKIYCIGGSTGTINSGDAVTGANEVYDPITDTWENWTAMPSSRLEVSAFVMNGKIYVTSGLPNGTLNEEYDPAMDTWTTKAPLPLESGLPQMYNPENDTWSTVSAWMFGRYVVATSGVYAPERFYFVIYSETQVYDFAADSFASGAVMPTMRDVFAVAVADDKIYAIGGYNTEFGGLSEYFSTGDMYKFIYYDTVEEYTPFGYGTIPPKITVDSPEIGNYTLGNVSLAFTVNKPATWIGYSLDDQDNITITGNITLTGLSLGSHSVTVYAKDEFENIDASDTVTLSIVEPEHAPEPFPTALVAVASVASAGIIAVGLLVYFKKRKH
jgi:hypothetical protein